jgi:hypothetical protein
MRSCGGVPMRFPESMSNLDKMLLRRGGIYVIGDMLPFRNPLGWKVMRLG